MPTYLAFGDSNTHGTKPVPEEEELSPSFARWPYGTRWSSIAHNALADDWMLAEEGLPGRTTRFSDPIMGAHMDGQTGLKIALMTHAPVALISIMLGTNDVKARLGAQPDDIAAGICSLIDILRDPELVARAGEPQLLLIAPPPVQVTGIRAAEWLGSAEKSRALAPLFEQIAGAYNVEFLDAGQIISVAPGEGIHFTEDSHRALGQAVGAKLAQMAGRC
ncbi:MAG: GDSL-type esterase/lipase family protein [Pseudomonadota bacterium]